jgi:uncharacterized protein
MYIKNPFVYGQVVTGHSFTNRTEEKARLSANLLNGIHTIIISPRRWGKSSLVEEVFNKLSKSDEIRTVKLDLTAVLDEREFYARYAKEVIKATSTKAHEVLETIKYAFRSFRPEVSFDPSETSFSLGFNFKDSDLEKGFKDILDLPETIAKKKGIKVLVALDEFQNIGSFPNPALFQGRLRSVLQFHKNVSYCFYGSKKHMMEEIFHHKSAPFYQFGDILNFKKIDTSDFFPFLKKKFDSTGKPIDAEEINTILNSVDNHPHYVQFIAYKTWESTTGKIKPSDVSRSIAQVVSQFDSLLSEIFSDLSRHQKALLIGLVKSVEGKPYSQAFIKDYGLGSSSNVSVVLKVLVKKDIVTQLEDNRVVFIDPMFRLWLLSKS